jgi:YidC/Oxa1 family membrane protein insertase
MFTTLIVQPIFNLLVLIYALLPGHNFGLALIIFTVIVRLLLWPLVKKQLHQAKAMRKLQPELKKIKRAAAGDRQKESTMMMALYKERGINPFGSIGVLLLQIPILIGLYAGLRRVIDDPHQLVTFSYPALQHLGWMKELAGNIHLYDSSLLGIVDLKRAALGNNGIYWPAMLIVVGSAITQYYQAKQLMPKDKDARSLKTILKDAGSGRQADQGEVNAAVGRSTRFIFPAMIFLFTINLPAALGLYWFVGGLVAYIQQAIVLREDEEEMEKEADEPTKKPSKAVIEGEVVETKPAAKKSSKKPTKKGRKK